MDDQEDREHAEDEEDQRLEQVREGGVARVDVANDHRDGGADQPHPHSRDPDPPGPDLLGDVLDHEQDGACEHGPEEDGDEELLELHEVVHMM
ncbi:hypothetical protein D3C87_1804070 [compost metagenome]